jgi:hypothetical protein
MRRVQGAREGEVMTPEEARELGCRGASEHLIEAMGPVYNGKILGIISDLEDAGREAAPASASPSEKDLVAAHFLRGSALHFRVLVQELEARAAALEATR